nr:EAL domain-containing protein [Lysinibacillus timonensis]
MRTKSVKFWAILLIFIMCLTTMSLFGFLASKSVEKSIQKQYKLEAESVLNQTKISFESSFSLIENILEQLKYSLMLQESSNEQEINGLFDTYQNILPSNSTGIYGVINDDLYSVEELSNSNSFNPYERDWFKAAVENKENVSWTEPYLDYVTQKIVISASLYVGGSKHEGVIAIDIELSDLSNLISKSQVGESGLVMLLNQYGTILANRNNYLIGENLFGQQHQELIKKTNEKFVPYAINKSNYLVRSTTIHQNGMSIITAISKEELNSKLIQSLMPILIVGIVCISIFSVLAYMIALIWMRPLKKLGTLMNHVENGNYNVRAKAKEYQEVARLAKGFNNMIHAIKKRDRDLMISNYELKQTEERLRSKYDELKESQRILKESEETVAHLASHDSLTGLLNRRSLIEQLNKSLVQDQDQMKAIIFIDLDNFKMINDTLGHSFGDKLIIKVASLLKSISHFYKYVARISGDEFILVLHDIDSEKDVDVIAKEIVKLFESGIVIDSKILNVTSSIGVALYPRHGLTSEDLLKNADMAMYRAKGSGKNGYRIFDESIKKEIDEKLEIELGIRKSLETNEFELFYQPLFNTKEKRITSIEALLRTNSPELSKFGILKVIQTAEVTGQIIEIDNWVLGMACQSIKQINRHIAQPINISVNISPIHIMHQDFVSNVRTIVNNAGIPPEWIELEITETSLMKSFDVNLKKLEELKSLGISIHLDDFGTGYSSLSYLNSLPIDRVKIDKSFVDVMFQSEKERKIIETIISLAHNIGLQVVAEGVEEREQFELLATNGCELIQGYYISKPLNFEKIAMVLLENDISNKLFNM